MSDSSKKQDDLLSAFDLGPAWARSDSPQKDYKDHKGDDQGDRRGRGKRPSGGFGGGGGRSFGGVGGQRGGGKGRQDGRGRGGEFKGRGADASGGFKRDLPDPTPGVRVTVAPSVEAVHLLVKEIQHRARVYSLFDVAQLFLNKKESCVLEITVDEKHNPLYRGKHDDSLFATKEEAVAHFLQSKEFVEYYETDEVETEPPSGNFQVVARCGISGEWLGPPNFHSYQTNLRRLHRERFSNMPFERYSAKVRTERGEEAVEAWLETMKKRVRWRRKGADDDDWTFERSVIERDVLTNSFGEFFEETRKTVLPGNVPAQHLSVGVLAAIRISGTHARRHPAMLIPTICRMLESDHLAIFKRKGKLFCGPARPHPLEGVEKLSDRPAAIVTWLDGKENAKLEELWKELLPEDATEPPKEWLVDLFWLLTQGHVLLFADNTLVLPKRSQPSGGQREKPKQDETSKPAKKKRRKKKGPKVRKARYPAQARQIRAITRMKPGSLKRLRGGARLWKRRLAKREKIHTLLEDE